ncbi:MAG: hypothetical protein ACLT0Y_03330 [Christensenellales bacterium]
MLYIWRYFINNPAIRRKQPANGKRAGVRRATYGRAVFAKNRAGKETKMETRSRYRTAPPLILDAVYRPGRRGRRGGHADRPEQESHGDGRHASVFQVLPFAEVVFQDFTFSGIALLIVNGLNNLTAAGFFGKEEGRDCVGRQFRYYADAVDLHSVLYVSAEFYVTAYFIFGLCQAATGYAAWIFTSRKRLP